MSKVIFIDTSDNQKAIVILKIGNKQYRKEVKGERKSQIVLSLIDEILKKNKLKLADLSGIEVNTGPGSFTGVRIGVAIANALGFVLKIPINGKKIGETVSPVYNNSK